MNLTLFFRLIVMSIFQEGVTHNKKTYRGDMSYDTQHFYCPRVYAMDGFNISLQITYSSYCSTENGYRKFGHTYNTVEFGFPSEDDALLHQYSQMNHDEEDSELTSVGTVGEIPVSVLETLFEKRGGVDWEKTISVANFEYHTSKVQEEENND